MILSRRGQSVLEYTMIVGIIVAALYYMGTGIKRGVQSLVKVTSDQVGRQQNADQDFNDIQTGYMMNSMTGMQENNNGQTTETGYIPAGSNCTGANAYNCEVYVTNTSFNESTDTMTNTVTNGGFTQVVNQ